MAFREKTKRNSSLELLRIICILVIIGYHYAWHGGYAAFSEYTFCDGVVFVQIQSMFGKVACSVFALITGYFLIQQTGPLKQQYKKLFPLVIEVYFYYLVILAVFTLIPGFHVTLKETFFLFFPFCLELGISFSI